MNLTKDEKFLIKLHETAAAKGNPETEVDRFAVGRSLGQKDKIVDNIVRHLAQANFVKKGEGQSIYLTSQGLRLIDTLLNP